MGSTIEKTKINMHFQKPFKYKPMLTFIYSLFVLIPWTQNFAQQFNDEMSLIFIGDIMGHGPQIKSAYIDSTDSYSYENVFKYIKDEISDADFTIANLEVTLAGKPFKGYPQFSSPDALGEACKKNGIDAFVLSNNHSCDRGKNGIIRTIDITEKLGLLHTGTFRNEKERDSLNLLLLEKNNIKVGILNYTYGTNGLPYPAPTIVNMIDTALMAKDIDSAHTKMLDKLIVFIHWGAEYQSQPNTYQKNIAEFLFNKNVDIIIGSHPHVLQKMIYLPKSEANNESFIAYSLGNYVSNQRDRRKDGGCMVKLVLNKNGEDVVIREKGYILTWVHKTLNGNKYDYRILPCSKYENDSTYFKKKEEMEKMNIFIKDSRKLFNNYNENVGEYIYLNERWKFLKPQSNDQ